MNSPGCGSWRAWRGCSTGWKTAAPSCARAALTLALGFGALAYRFGFAAILGSFAAGLLARMIDLSGHTPHPQFQTKLEGIGFGFGFSIPIFFIPTGVQFDLKALLGNATAIAEVPLFLAALLLVRGLPLRARVTGSRVRAGRGPPQRGWRGGGFRGMPRWLRTLAQSSW